MMNEDVNERRRWQFRGAPLFLCRGKTKELSVFQGDVDAALVIDGGAAFDGVGGDLLLPGVRPVLDVDRHQKRIAGFRVGVVPRNVPTICASVCASLTLPAKTSLRLIKPLASNTRARVTNGQSERFSFDLPRAALSLPTPEPSKYVLVKS